MERHLTDGWKRRMFNTILRTTADVVAGDAAISVIPRHRYQLGVDINKTTAKNSYSHSLETVRDIGIVTVVDYVGKLQLCPLSINIVSNDLVSRSFQGHFGYVEDVDGQTLEIYHICRAIKYPGIMGSNVRRILYNILLH